MMVPDSTTQTLSSEAVAVAIAPGFAPAVQDLSPRSSQQNWVLDPLQDTLLIIVAPLFTLALALASIYFFGIVKGATLVLVSHVVFTVAHHLPTFIRIYGDVELFRRYRWHFVFAPIISLSFSMAVLTYINIKSYPLESFLYLYILLTLWDPWHFMRQHYGFMRIYDRNNAAPKQVTSRMDLMLSISWFAYIMVASGDWMLDLLQDMYTRVQWPLLLSVTNHGLTSVTGTLRVMAFISTVAYIGYLLWCWKKNYFVSPAKVLMCVTTFGVMYLTYTPNVLIRSLAPGWSFKIGFAVIGIVHMTQYLAIVWRYNRGLASRAGRARSGIFNWIHSRGAWWAAGIYIVACLAYGDIVTTVHNSEWLMATLLAVGFTSTMMHYYFDGFIWKVRHRENQEALTNGPRSSSSTEQTSQSWWTSLNQVTAKRVLGKQFLYFAVPMSVLTIAAVSVWGSANNNDSSGGYIDHMYRAQELNTRGFGNEAEQEARMAYQAMQTQLPLLQKRTELQPTTARKAELAFLIFNESLYGNIVMPALDGQQRTAERLQHHRVNIENAIEQLTQAVNLSSSSSESLAHPGREQFNLEEAQRVLASWRRQVG